VWDAERGKRLSGLFYDMPIAQVAVPRSLPLRLLVADLARRVFSYRLQSP
jgi:hypothetical protein